MEYMEDAPKKREGEEKIPAIRTFHEDLRKAGSDAGEVAKVTAKEVTIKEVEGKEVREKAKS